MTLSIGRVTGLPEPTEPPAWVSRAGVITLTGSYKASSVLDGLVKRDQLLGYQNNWDEPIVPVIMANEPRLTGYYRVVDVSVTTDKFTRLSGNLYDYVVTLQPVMGFTQPAFESIISGALLTNVVGAVAANGSAFHAVPLAVVEYVGLDNSLLGIRSSADGNLGYFQPATGSTYSWTSRFALPIASFYTGAALIEQGNPLQPLVGRQLTQLDTVNWRLSNGLVRITPNATPGKLDVAHWKGAAWGAAKTYKFTGATLATGFTSFTVLRNSCEESIIRLGLSFVAVSPPVYLDISVRRGDRFARCFISTPINAQAWICQRDSVEAATAISYAAVTTGGIRATANDADGNRYVMLSYQKATTNDLVNGAIVLSAISLTFDIGIGSEIGGSGSSGIDTAVAQAGAYLAAQSESQRIIAR